MLMLLHHVELIDIHKAILNLEILQKILKYCKNLEILPKKFQLVRIARTKKGLDEALECCQPHEIVTHTFVTILDFKEIVIWADHLPTL